MNLTRQQLRDLYPTDMDISIGWDGLQNVLTTDMDVEGKQILEPLLDRAVPVNSFREISRSTKRMFQEVA